MKMVTYYNTKDLVKFGQYVLSKKREDRLRQSDIENPKGLPYEERFRQIDAADIANCFNEKKDNLLYSGDKTLCKIKNTLESSKESYDYPNKDGFILVPINEFEFRMMSLPKESVSFFIRPEEDWVFQIKVIGENLNIRRRNKNKFKVYKITSVPQFTEKVREYINKLEVSYFSIGYEEKS